MASARKVAAALEAQAPPWPRGLPHGWFAQLHCGRCGLACRYDHDGPDDLPLRQTVVGDGWAKTALGWLCGACSGRLPRGRRP